MSTLSGFPDDMTDSLTLKMVLEVTKEDGGVLGERVFYKSPDGDETDLPIGENNILTGTDVLANADAAGELCREGPAGVAPAEKSRFSANMAFAYNTAGGSHTSASLFDGAKDGRNQLKALAPAAVRLMVPRLRYVVVARDHKTGSVPVVTVLRAGAPIDDFKVQYYQGMPTFTLADLKSVKADTVKIDSPGYELMAMPKPNRKLLSDTPQDVSPAAAP